MITFSRFGKQSLNPRPVGIVMVLLLVRLAISLLSYSEVVTSDPQTYAIIALDFYHNGELDLVSLSGHAIGDTLTLHEIQDLIVHASSTSRGWYYDFQILTPIVYAPLIAWFPNMFCVVLVNNLLWFLTSVLLVKTFREDWDWVGTSIFGMLMFFPFSFNYITNRLMTENVFLLLLACLLFLIFRPPQTKWKHIALLACIVLLGITRPVGLVLASGIAFYFFLQRRRLLAMIVLAGVIAAIGTNQLLKTNFMPFVKEKVPMVGVPFFMENFYSANSPKGVGDIDPWNAGLWRKDTNYVAFVEQRVGQWDLVIPLVKDVIQDPLGFTKTLVNRILSHFLNLWPQSWGFKQDLRQRFVYLSILVPLYMLILAGLAVDQNPDRKRIFLVLFVTNLVFYILFLARFRYILPIVVIMIPFACTGFLHFLTQSRKLVSKIRFRLAGNVPE